MICLQSPLLILGNQLFGPHPGLQNGRPQDVILIEDTQIAGTYAYHQLRLLHQFVAMREYADQLKAQGHRVHYLNLEGSNPKQHWLSRVSEVLKRLKAKELRVAEISDSSFREAFRLQCKPNGIALVEVPSPYFWVQSDELNQYFGSSKKPFMKTFYERVRVSKEVLVDSKGNPVGGRFSFDTENRKKLPKGMTSPMLPQVPESKHAREVIRLIEKYFSKNPGRLSHPEALWVPYTRAGAIDWLRDFLKVRFENFGPYEDAIEPHELTLFHSVLSPLMNLGLLTPKEVVEAALSTAKKREVPLESLEGFVRQILGWREFLHGIHERYGAQQSNSNFFKHRRKLNSNWYSGKTGLPPVDAAIQRAHQYAYNHHIERLMVLGNVMLLSQIDPLDAHRWFMEMYLDSYEWVMGPNVYGMSQFSDGGLFATKPYISGSNYILKMSHYPKGEWCEVWDGLYWNFIASHLDFFKKNPRLSMMAQLWIKMDKKKQSRHQNLAQEFMERNSSPA
jgi:deoxyribodipyrimidine photolyase-related protein